ncbi:hypothetical protein [Isoptericola sp. QY 916]|uniref:hypothetical protein n=1 Tax=Isoptericola sp. QY 916 TaxID=2782570 RepID=UPI003D2FEB19|nr:hypothetical protein [Isoptericola sp. QY 916]
MEIRTEQQLNPVADHVSALTAIVRPILQGTLYSLKGEVVETVGGYEQVPLFMLPRLLRPGDGDCGICFEYAVHDAISRGEASTVERVADALKRCKVSTQDIGSILFGAEKSGAQQLIDTAAEALTSESRLMSGLRGHPVKLRRHLSTAAAAFRRQGARNGLPQSIAGLWKADLFLGSRFDDRWVGTTVKINPTKLEGARGLRVGIVPSQEGASDAIRIDDRRNLVVCPLPYDAAFVEVFYLAWEVVQAFLAADANLPKEVALPMTAQRHVARKLVARRQYAVVDVIDALAPLAQPELLRTDEELATMQSVFGGNAEQVTGVLAPRPDGL